MQRPRDRASDNILEKIYPSFFWTLCEKCFMEFKQEHGWMFKKYWHDDPRYVCARCFPTEEDAKRYFLVEHPEWPWMRTDDW